MSYRITLNRPPVVECDTPEEVFALADLAMERQQPADEPQRFEEPATTKPRAVQLRPRGIEHTSPAKMTKAVVNYLRESTCAKRAKAIAQACGIEIDALLGVLSGPEFEVIGRGMYRLAGESQSADGDSRRDSQPPRRQPEPAAKSAVSKPGSPDLAEQIRRVLAKEGAIGIGTIALAVGQPGTVVKDVLRSRDDLFRLNPRAGGWELRPS